MYKRLFTIFVIFIITAVSVYSQFAIHRTVVPSQPSDSADIAFYSKKKGLGAATQIFSFNMGLWTFNRYVAKQDYAYIDIHTIRKNIKHKWVWDNDDMGNNMFLHPYHGNLYFNSARSRGYNFWESGAFALGGSAMWELLMENEYPSFNDIIATPVGGLALGEVFYRTSDLVLDDRRDGMNRFGRELAGFLIAPTRGLTRVLNGDAWRKRVTTGKQFGVPDVSVEIGTGVRVLELKGQILDKGVGAAVDINIEYGDRFATENEKPYDYFSFRSNLNVQGSQPLLSQLNILGRLYVTEVVDNEKDFLSFGFYQHFDYYDSDTISGVSGRIPYKFCTPASAGSGFIYENKRWKNLKFTAFMHSTLVLLGGTLSDHYVVDKRNYNLASGFSSKIGGSLTYKNKISISTSHEMYRMFTWRGYPENVDWENINVHEFDYQGDRSQAILHAFTLRADMKMTEHLYLTGIYSNYTRDTNYRYLENVFSKTSEGRLLLSYKF
jgi:hypothetical protein